jgi:hypothetical protein
MITSSHFTTTKGSTYRYDPGGKCTQRTKSPHPGHHPSDVGTKAWSHLTVYVSSKDAKRVGMHGSLQGSPTRILQRGQRLFLVSWNTQENRWGVSPNEREGIPFTETPSVGSAPLELWRDQSEGWGKWHAGNAIVEITEE